MLSSSQRAPHTTSRNRRNTLNRQIRDFRHSTSSSRSSLSSSQNLMESSAIKHKWVQTRQVNIIINRLSEFISGLYISRNSVTELNQYLENLKQLVSIENSYRQSLSSMTINFWKVWNQFSENLNNALKFDESPRILSFVKEQFNSAEYTIRKLQGRSNPSITDLDQKLQSIYDKFEAIQQIESFENVENISDVINEAKIIYTFVKQNNRQLFASQIECSYVLNSIERGIQSLNSISNDDNLRDQLVDQYKNASISFKKLVPESNIKKRGKSVPNDDLSKSAPNLSQQQTNKTAKPKPKPEDPNSKKKKKPKPPVFDVPYTTNPPPKPSKKRSVTPPTMGHHSRHRTTCKSAMINGPNNFDAISTATNNNNQLGLSNGPQKYRSNADYIIETQKQQIQQRRKHRTRDAIDSTKGSVYNDNRSTNYNDNDQNNDKIGSPTILNNTNASITNEDANNQDNVINNQSPPRERRKRWNIIKENKEKRPNISIQMPLQQPETNMENQNDQQPNETTNNDNNQKESNENKQQNKPEAPPSPSSFVDNEFESAADATDVRPYVFEIPGPLENNNNTPFLSQSDVWGDDEGEDDGLSIKFSTVAKPKKKQEPNLSSHSSKHKSSHHHHEPEPKQQPPAPVQEQPSSSRHKHSHEKQNTQPQPQQQPVQAQESSSKHKHSHQSDASKKHKHSNPPAPAPKPAPAPAPKPAPAPAPKPAPAPAPTPKPAPAPAPTPKPAPAPAPKPAQTNAKKEEYEYYDDEEEDDYYDGYYDD